jgi:hypothetical protein
MQSFRKICSTSSIGRHRSVVLCCGVVWVLYSFLSVCIVLYVCLVFCRALGIYYFTPRFCITFLCFDHLSSLCLHQMSWVVVPLGYGLSQQRLHQVLTFLFLFEKTRDLLLAMVLDLYAKPCSNHNTFFLVVTGNQDGEKEASQQKNTEKEQHIGEYCCLIVFHALSLLLLGWVGLGWKTNTFSLLGWVGINLLFVRRPALQMDSCCCYFCVTYSFISLLCICR